VIHQQSRGAAFEFSPALKGRVSVELNATASRQRRPNDSAVADATWHIRLGLTGVETPG
jgi:hypothetical protein